MSYIDHSYVVNEVRGLQVLSYFFFSEGENPTEDVLKIIQYEYVQDYNNKRIYNLGFGDFDMENGQLNDKTITDNGDVYKIFNTVLNTIPKFYGKHPQAIILVQGSDGRKEYEALCRSNCTRQCVENCRNFNRRMRIYCNYVNRKCDNLKSDFQFFGGMRNNVGWFDFEEFMPGKLYDAIMVYQKNA